MRQHTVANKALEAVDELPVVERVERRRPEFSWDVARPLVDVTMLTVACFAAVIGSEAAGVGTPPVGEPRRLRRARARPADAARHRTSPASGRSCSRTSAGSSPSTSLAAMSVLTLRELFAEPPELAAQTIRPWAFATAYLAAGRIALHWSQSQARRQGEAMRPTLIVGAGRVGRLVAKRLLAYPELGLKPIGFLDKEPLDALGRLGHGAGARRQLGPRRGHRRPRRRAGDRHLLDGPERGAAAARPPLRGARRQRLLRPAPVRAGERPRHRRAHRRPAARHGASRRTRAAGSSPSSTRLDRVAAALVLLLVLPVLAARRGRDLDLARPADLLPAGARRPRRPAVRDAQVPLDARRPSPATRTSSSSCRPTRPRRRRGRRPAHARRRLPARSRRSTSCRSCSTSSRAR